MGRRTVADELRRVVVRIGGLPAVHGVAPPAPEVHPLGAPAAAVHALLPGACAAAVRAEPPGARTAAVRVPAPAAAAHGGTARLAAAARGTIGALPPPGTGEVAAIAAPAAGAVASRPRTPRTAGVPVVHTAARDARVALPASIAARSRAPLPGRARVRRPRRTPAVLLAPRRRRAAWDALDRARLAGGWRQVLADHRLPAEELELVGIYGPLRLGLVAGVRLEGDGRLEVRMAPRGLAGPVGDLAIARHVPSGRLLRSAHPWGGGGRRGLH